LKKECFVLHYGISNGATTTCGQGQRIRYNDSLRAGCPGIESRWEARFSAPAQPAPYTMGTGSSRGKAAGAWRWLPTRI